MTARGPSNLENAYGERSQFPRVPGALAAASKYVPSVNASVSPAPSPDEYESPSAIHSGVAAFAFVPANRAAAIRLARIKAPAVHLFRIIIGRGSSDKRCSPECKDIKRWS